MRFLLRGGVFSSTSSQSGFVQFKCWAKRESNMNQTLYISPFTVGYSLLPTLVLARNEIVNAFYGRVGKRHRPTGTVFLIKGVITQVSSAVNLLSDFPEFNAWLVRHTVQRHWLFIDMQHSHFPCEAVGCRPMDKSIISLTKWHSEKPMMKQIDF